MVSSLWLLMIALIIVIAMGAKDDKHANYHKRTGAKYLAETAQKEGVIELKSGMLVEILKTSSNPDAKSPTPSDPCEVTYKGTLKDGTKFDAGTTSFAPNQVIKGWTEAMQYMTEGDKWILHIPYDLAYGARGSPPRIPAYATLVFEIEIHKVKKGGKSAAEAREMFEAGKKTKADAVGTEADL